MSLKLTILGATGSIGKSTLKVIDAYPDKFKLYGLSCNSNLSELRLQLNKYSPEVVAISSNRVENSHEFKKLRSDFPEIDFLTGEKGLVQLASAPVDILLSAIVGSAGLRPTIAAIGKSKRIALANKETLVMAGDIVKELARKHGTEIIPVDSEHSAIFSLISNDNCKELDKIILTASGGSLRDKSKEELEKATVEEALNHPTWNMGSKITIDSATLFNKGLEVIEAHHLFDIPYEKIDVIIHPESVVHSMVEALDGSIYAHMGVTDMVFPIANALFYPEVFKNSFGKLDLCKVGNISFREYDSERFPALKLCYEAGKESGTMPTVMNAANEVSVAAFLNRKIRYYDIVKVVTKAMDTHTKVSNPTLDEIFHADKTTREKAEEIIRGL